MWLIPGLEVLPTAGTVRTVSDKSKSIDVVQASYRNGKTRRIWVEANRERLKEYSRKWDEKNKDRRRANQRDWYRENHATRRAYLNAKQRQYRLKKKLEAKCF